ncbi:ribosomal protein L1p/L10e family-domain-containing protein [Gymnopilus junonius]|uniref:Ribosomal L1 domain-containing protein 1 n=1 Tax=Gymnopilus junonius TaxID=109634 RepID=A0A9P5NP88_GYMJU|nr:ribosomal protein L1p/L10e family-domain-containing protein [Gymnopilus junonius]
MAKGILIDSHVSLKQCKKAVEALHTHELKKKEKFEENQLLPAKEQNVWLNVTVKTIPPGHRLKPVKIPIVHPLVDPRTSAVCLITKDPQREYKDLLEKHNIKFISRVVGIEKLKGKFKPFEARRMLLKENGLFLADERVVPLLPKLLGSKWFEAKKQPIPVCLTRKDLKGELERAISSTYMNQNQGTCTSIKVGKLSQTPSQILDNLQTALPAIAKAIKGNWDNIQSLHIKTNSSVSLPIWSCTLDDAEGGRWHGLQAEDEDEDESIQEDEVDSEEDVEDAKSRKVTSKSRKRASTSEEDEQEDEQPKKKAKADDGSSTKKDKKAVAQKPSKFASADIDSPAKKHKAVEAPAKSAKPASTRSDTVTAKKAQKPTIPPTVELSSTVTVPEGKKKKKSQQPAATRDAPPQTLLSMSSEGSSKKKKKVESSADTISSANVVTVTSPSVAAPAGKDSSGKEKKISKSPEAVLAPASSSEKPAKPTLSKDEVKQKRNGGVGEKKKELVAKTKGGKSAKNAVLGKKVAQE